MINHLRQIQFLEIIDDNEQHHILEYHHNAPFHLESKPHYAFQFETAVNAFSLTN